MNRRAMIALAAAMAASPALGQETTTTETATEAVAAPEVKDFSLGNPDAPVKIVEYASFTCPHCAHFHDRCLQALEA